MKATFCLLRVLLLSTVVVFASSAAQLDVQFDSAASSLNVQLCANPGGLGTQCDNETRPASGFARVALDNNGNPAQIALRNFDVRAVGDYNLSLAWLFGAARVDATASNLRILHSRPGPTNTYAPLAGSDYSFPDVPFMARGTATYRINDLACGFVTVPCSSNIDLAMLGENSIGALPGTLAIANGILTLHLDFTFETPLDLNNPDLGTLRGHAILHGSAPLNTSLVPPGSDWRYLDTGVDPGIDWAQRSFTDFFWAYGPGQLGYGDGDEAAVVGFGPNPNNRYITTYFRHTFNVLDVFDITNLALRVLHDDGAVVYLNGSEIYRGNMPAGPIDRLTLAPTAINGADENIRHVVPSVDPSALVNGPNVLAVEIHQSAPGSTDISFDLEALVNTVITDQPPTVAIINPTNGATLPEGAVLIQASATDVDGGIARVAFYQGTRLLAEDMTAPYQITWSPVCAGRYGLTAHAIDSAGNEGISTPVVIDVSRVPVTLINAGAVWRYRDNGTDQGTTWRNRTFDDSTWASGAAQLGFGDGDETTTVNGGPSTNRFITTYFRHAFPVTTAAGISALHLQLLRDDGALVYLNGNEIFRNNMPAGAVNYLTLASTNAAGADETTNVISATVSAAGLIEGVNVLAVEVHQGAINSSDLSFALAVSASVTNLPPSVVTLTSPPAGDVEFPVGATVLLTAAANDPDGGITRVEYFRGTNRLGSANSAPYSFNWVNAPAGYHIVTARAFDACGSSRDSAPVPVRVGAFSMIARGSFWRYLDNGSDQGTTWRAPTFNDSAWAIGPAILGFGEGDETTVVNGGPAGNRFITTYFRRSWQVPDPTIVTGLVVRLLRDDGAAVYLNGAELFRSNLPEGPIDSTTLASAAVGGAEERTYFVTSAGAGQLVAGDNLLAVEIHQQGAPSSDLSFDLELIGLVRPQQPMLTIERAGSNHIVRWPSAAAGYRLQFAPGLSIGTDWQDLSLTPLDDGTWRSLTQPNSAPARFYRLRP